MKKIVLSPSGKEVECSDDQTVLSALEKNGYALPNNCRAGACGECKIKVLNGEFDQGFVLSMALSDTEKAEGYGLMCMAKVTSETLEIEWATADAKPKLFPPTENRPYIVTDKREVTPSIVKLVLRSLGKPMRFWPGQYIMLGSSDKNIPERPYSIANIPNSNGEIVLYITKVNEGKTSTWIHDELNLGDQTSLSGPYGTFIGDPSVEKPVLCLAAGSGLAPILSLSQAALLSGGFKHPATILFSARSKNDLYEQGLFSYLTNKFRNFDFKYTLTGDEEAKLKGRIPEVLSNEYPDLSQYSIYIAGSPEFVDDCKKKSIELGADENHIHVEGFFNGADAQTPSEDQLLS